MSIEQLIRDLILEDQFKAKYTKRQRSIFCENMYTKVTKFVEESNKERTKRIEDLENELDVLGEQLEVVKNDLDFYKEENQELNKNYKSIFTDMLWGLRFAFYITYLYAMWKHYKDNVDRSIKDTNSTSNSPYNIA